ncbi:MAG: HAD-IB family hydrolase, partial [Actinomycetota bacterium]
FRARLIGPGRLAHSLVHDVVFRQRGSTDGQIGSIAELALEMAEGVRLTDLNPVVSEAASTIANSIRPAMSLLLSNHLTAGHYCVVLSASPQPLVEEIAQLLGAHRGIGTVIEHDGDVLTGSIIQPMCYGPGKLERLDSALGWSADNGDDTHSYAYADSVSDLPLLESVDSPVVISPDRALRSVAGQRGWPVLDF